MAFVVSKNLHRRHLGEAERAMVAARVATLKNGNNQHKKEGASIEAPSNGPAAVTQEQAADMLNVSRASVQRAREVLDHGTPALQQAVDDGIVSVSDAAAVAHEPPAVQAAAVEAVKGGKARTARGEFN